MVLGPALIRATARCGAQLAREGDVRKEVLILLDGFAVATKRTKEGAQQNVAIHIGGDVIGQDGYVLGACFADVITLTKVDYIQFAHEQLAALLEVEPHFARAFWRQVAFQGAIGREWILNLGRRPALSRMAHLFCEIVFRLHLAGQGELSSCMMPMTQNDLGDALGLSTVHVNRTLMNMRKQGLVELRRGRLSIPDWHRLVEVAQFEGSCLMPAS